MSNKFHKMRIAFSVACGILCLLLIVLWVRSYWRWDNFYLELGTKQATVVATWQGTLQFGLTGYRTEIPIEWVHRSMPIEEFLIKMKDILVTENFGLVRLAYSSPQEWFVQIRIWLPVLFAGALAVLPWIHWSKRFSLRTLLIITTLLAVLLGGIVYTSR
jgi:hypothetical protein